MIPIVIGIDPSSSKIAVVVVKGGRPVTHHVLGLPPKQPAETCTLASKFINDLIVSLQYPEGIWDEVPDPLPVHVFLEAPVYAPKAGPGSLIPQAQVSGAILAACGLRGVPVELVDNAVWKKDVIGSGSASKIEIARWVRMHCRSIYLAAQADQDVCDAACIALHGSHFVHRLKRLRRTL